MSKIVQMPVAQFRDNSQKPIRFDNLHPGSMFRIVSEPSRGILQSTDKRVYRKDLVGFFATPITNADVGVVLMPYDKVMPVVRLKNGAAQLNPKSAKTADTKRQAV